MEYQYTAIWIHVKTRPGKLQSQLGLSSLEIRPISKGSRWADTTFTEIYGLLLDLIVPGSC